MGPMAGNGHQPARYFVLASASRDLLVEIRGLAIEAGKQSIGTWPGRLREASWPSAEFRFKALTGAGYTAAVRNVDGEAFAKRSFNPNADETLFFPRLVGG
jgi:hypothetical protein